MNLVVRLQLKVNQFLVFSYPYTVRIGVVLFDLTSLVDTRYSRINLIDQQCHRFAHHCGECRGRHRLAAGKGGEGCGMAEPDSGATSSP